MTALDMFVLLTLGGAAIVGFVRGFLHEVIALAAWIAGIVAVKLFHTPLADKLVGPVGTEAGATVLAFALLFLPAYLALKMFAKAVGMKTRGSMLGPVDKVLGGGFGMVKGLIGATLVFLLANLATDIVYGTGSTRPEWMTSSRSYRLLQASGRAVIDYTAIARDKAGLSEKRPA